MVLCLSPYMPNIYNMKTTSTIAYIILYIVSKERNSSRKFKNAYGKGMFSVMCGREQGLPRHGIGMNNRHQARWITDSDNG